MKKFIFKISLYSLPLLTLALLVEITLQNIPNNYSYKKEHLTVKSKFIETLILGGSDAFRGLNPIYFSQNTFNASHVSQTIEYDWEILKKYGEKLSNIRTLILPISYYTLFGKLENSKEFWRIKNYILYWEVGWSPDITNHSEILSNNFSENKNRIISYYLKSENPLSCSNLGWAIREKQHSSKDIERTGKAAAIRHTALNFNFYAENLNILTSIIEYCQRKNISIILFTAPAYKTYVDNLNKEQLKLTIQTANELSKTYSNCTYVNLLTDTSFVKKDFYDADHLNDNGAKKLSNIINDIIKNKSSEDNTYITLPKKLKTENI